METILLLVVVAALLLLAFAILRRPSRSTTSREVHPGRGKRNKEMYVGRGGLLVNLVILARPVPESARMIRSSV